MTTPRGKCYDLIGVNEKNYLSEVNSRTTFKFTPIEIAPINTRSSPLDIACKSMYPLLHNVDEFDCAHGHVCRFKYY